MAGYTRQSAASIINGENITAPPINAEFNTLQDAFNGTTGHAHDGTTGNGPKIDLATSVSGFLPAANGGLGGKNNYAATTDPTVGDDTNDGYVVGSVWYNVPDDRYYVCVYNAAGAAVWLENRFINSNGDFAPHANNTKDLGHTLKRWKDLFLSGNADIDGSLNVATTTYLGGILTVNANAVFNVGTTTTISNIDVASGAIDNAAIGTTVAASGTFTTLSATTSLTAATADINGGSIDGATVGANSHSTGKFTTLESTGLATLNSVNIDGGAIDGAVIGANSAVAGSFTTISSAGQATLASVDINGGAIDGATIGATSASTITGTTITGTSLVGPVTGNVTGNTSGTHTGPVTGAVTGNLTGNVTSSGTSTFNNVTIDGTLNMNAGTSATITNLSAPTNANDAARKVDVDNAVANLVDSAPGTLDTLNELAAALGDDPDFATTITNSIATKLPLAGGTMTGAIAMSTNKITGVGDPTAAQDVSSKAYTDQQDALQVTKSGDSMSGNLAMGSNNITGLATPTANDHAVNKSYADNILGSSTAAATSASNAATSESNAATSATNASNSATAAASSATSAAASYDSFDDRYLGAKSSAPTVDNDGDALIVGALYFDSTAGAMKVYSANGWTNAGSSVNGTTNRYSYTATAGQTVFAATYDAGYVDVFLNGVKQLVGTDVTATSGTSVVFASATTVNDIVEIVGYGTFVLADHLTQTQSDARYVNLSGDAMTGNLSFGDNDKAIFGASSDLEIYHNGTDSYVSDVGTGILRLNSNGTKILMETAGGETLAEFINNGNVVLYSNDEERLRTNGTGIDVTGTLTSDALHVNSGASNLAGLFESTDAGATLTLIDNGTTGGSAAEHGLNTVGNQLEIRAVDSISFETGGAGSEAMHITSTGSVGIGTSLPTAALDIDAGSASGEVLVVTTSASTSNFDMINGDATHRFRTIDGSLRIGADHNNEAADSSIRFEVDSSEKMRITSTGSVGINELSPSSPLHVNGGGTNAVATFESTDAIASVKFVDSDQTQGVFAGAKGDDFYVQAGGSEKLRLTSSGRLGLGTQSPEALLDVAYNLPDDTNGIIRPLKLRTTDLANQTNLLAGDGVGILFEIPDQSSGSIGASIDAVKESGADDDTLTSLVFKTSANNETLREVMRLHSGGRVSVGLNDSDTTFGSFQVNQQTNNDESGIAIVDSTDGRSMRLWCDTTTSYINSGDGGSATLHLNQGAGGVRMGVHNNFEMKTDPSSTNAVVYIRSGESYNSGASTDLGTGTVMMQIEGDSDTLQVRNINSGDYAIVNSQQKNGIAFYDGTGGLGFYYGNSEKAEVTNAGFQTVSDERLKDNQGEMDIDAISVFNNLDLFKYHPKATPDDDNVDTDTLMYGFSAQQLHALAPVSVGAGVDDLSTDPKKPWYSVNDTSIKAMMIQAIKALSAENASLVARIEALEAQVTTP